jgi:tetratricopeptide (TPR) repeat protein
MLDPIDMRTHSLRSALAAALLAASCLALSPVALADSPGTEAIGRAEAAVSRGDYALALKELGEVSHGPERADAMVRKAKLELLTGRFAEADKTAKAAAALGKGAKLEAWAIRGEVLAAQGKYAEAIALLKEVEGEDEARRARLLLGELLIRTGKRVEAKPVLMTLIEDYNSDKITSKDAVGLTMVGRAAHLLRSPRDANDAFNAAEKAGAKKLVDTLLWRTELFLDKYDPGNAGGTVKDALKLAPKDPGRARGHRPREARELDGFRRRRGEINQALDVNPNLPGAYFVRAGLALRDMEIAAADAAADKGQAINPNDLELLSMKAAIRFLADDPAGFEAAKKKVFALNPEYSTLFQIVGEYAEWEHRYDDIVKMMGEAVAIDKRDRRPRHDGAQPHPQRGRAGGLDALKRPGRRTNSTSASTTR